MAKSLPVATTEAYASPLFDGKPMQLVLAPGSVSGYKRVIKVSDGTFSARRTVAGKQQHVWSSDDPRDCAYVLARLELEPCSEEAIKKACKEAAEGRTEFRRLKRKCDALSRKIERFHRQHVVAPRRAREAQKQASMDQSACVEREPLSPVRNGA